MDSLAFGFMAPIPDDDVHMYMWARHREWSNSDPQVGREREKWGKSMTANELQARFTSSEESGA